MEGSLGEIGENVGENKIMEKIKMEKIKMEKMSEKNQKKRGVRGFFPAYLVLWCCILNGETIEGRK